MCIYKPQTVTLPVHYLIMESNTKCLEDLAEIGEALVRPPWDIGLFL